jgi:ferric-dicitrate binding protein FerR (iron transport regulator)
LKVDHAYYRGFTKWQFAADEYFQEYVLNANPANEEFWKTHLQLDPASEDSIIGARKIVLDAYENRNSKEPLSYPEKNLLKARIYNELTLEIPEAKPLERIRKQKFIIIASAASILALIWLWTTFVNIPARKSILLVERSAPGETKEFSLPDSSIIILNSNSAIRFYENFLKHSNREVFLSGNAFFKVRKDRAMKPFVVHAGVLTVSVYGTEFNVDARTNATEVVLTSGKVKVTRKGDELRSAFMQPGDRWKLDTVSHQIIRAKVNAQLYAAWTEGKWIFNKTSLAEIAVLIKQYYGVDLKLGKAKDSALTISAIIPVTSVEKLIPVIEETLGITINHSNNNLIVH